MDRTAIGSMTSIQQSNSDKETSAIYLLYFARVDDPNTSERCPRNAIGIYIFGYTADFATTIEEHTKRYGRKHGFNYVLTFYEHIDPRFHSNAVKEAERYFTFRGYEPVGEYYEGTVFFPERKLPSVINKLKRISKKYVGCFKDINAKLIEKEHELKLAESEAERDQEKLKRELAEKNAELVSAQKDLIIANMKLDALQTKTSTKSKSRKKKTRSK